MGSKAWTKTYTRSDKKKTRPNRTQNVNIFLLLLQKPTRQTILWRCCLELMKLWFDISELIQKIDCKNLNQKSGSKDQIFRLLIIDPWADYWGQLLIKRMSRCSWWFFEFKTLENFHWVSDDPRFKFEQKSTAAWLVPWHFLLNPVVKRYRMNTLII